MTRVPRAVSGGLSPSDITSAQRDALELVRSSRLYRVRNGWQGAGTRRVALRTADALISRELVEIDYSGSAPSLALTRAGKDLEYRVRLGK